MSKPNIITTPSGDRMVLIPFEEYERLIEAAEDAADARDVDEIKRRLATGEEELIPAEIVDRIIDGENKLRVWREHRGMSAKELAETVSRRHTSRNSRPASEREPSRRQEDRRCTPRRYRRYRLAVRRGEAESPVAN